MRVLEARRMHVCYQWEVGPDGEEFRREPDERARHAAPLR